MPTTAHRPTPSGSPKPKGGNATPVRNPLDGRSPELVSHAAPREARPLRIFFSYGHDHNRERVDRCRTALE